MYNLNNLDITILVIVVISALIAINRGLVKEVLSIVGWVLSVVVIVNALPILLPIASNFIENGLIAGIATSLTVFVAFFIVWIYSTSSVVGKIRTSKLNGLDRFLGLFFGVMRAFLLIILFNIMISWIIPTEKQPEIFVKSRYYNLAGSFAKPLENMIPQETLNLIKEQTISHKEQIDVDKKGKKEDKNMDLFERLAQPKIKQTLKENFSEETKGYKKSEIEGLERLLDSVE